MVSNSNSTNPDLHIASLLIRLQPARLDAVCAALESQGCNVAHVDDGGSTLIVLIETNDEFRLSKIMNDASGLPGVYGANLVYHHAESEASLNETMTP